MPPRIKRIDHNGNKVEIDKKVDSIIDITAVEFAIACKNLGQDKDTAFETYKLFLDNLLDPEDLKLIQSEVKTIREDQVLMMKMQQVQKEGGDSKLKASMVNPRDTQHVKQKITRRDPKTGQVIALDSI